MKITRIEILKVPPSWIWVQVHTDEGLTGLGEPYLENHPESVITEVRRLALVLLGEDPTRIEHLWHAMYNAGLGYKGGPVTMSAISGLDIALWDLAGKAAGLPIHKLLGGATRERVKVYRATGGQLPWYVEPGQAYREGRPTRPAPDTPETYSTAARMLVQEWGFRALKVHFGPGDGLEATSQVNRFAERFAAVREGAGPNVDVAVDIHNPHPTVGSQLIEALAPFRPLFIEEPMPIERVDIVAEMARRTSAPIAAGERWMGKWIFFDALSRGALAVVQPDICHAGGITECHKIATIAEGAYAKVALHCTLSPIALAASLQLDAVIPNFLVQEHNEVLDWREGGKTIIGKGYLKDPLTLDAEGCVAVPQGPGLGIELDEAGMALLTKRPWNRERG